MGRVGRASVLGLVLSLAGCACSTSPVPIDAGLPPDAPADDVFAVDAPPSPDAWHPPTPVTALAFPQAVDGALWADPEIYPHLPIHVRVDGDARAVHVTIGSEVAEALDVDGDRDWIASVPIAASATPLTVGAMAEGFGTDTAMGTATLSLGTSGVALTEYGADGVAATPELHWVEASSGRQLWLSWCDEHEGAFPRSLWLQRLDGAGARAGGPVRVALSDTEATLAARVAFGGAHVGVLFQRAGTPYSNFFAVADPATGALVAPPIALEPSSAVGYVGGDVLFDGTAFVGLFRSNTTGGQVLAAVRVDETGAALAGPAVLSMGGMEGDPMGPFTAFGTISLAQVDPAHFVAAFARDRFDSTLGLAVPKVQVVRFGTSLTPAGEEYAGMPTSYFWQYPGRVVTTESGATLVWPETDLTSADPNPPAQFRLVDVGPNGLLAASRGNGLGLFATLPPEYRTEPTLDPAPGGGGTLVWTDDRSHAGDPTMGRIEMFAARIAAPGATLSQEVRVPHARFIEETALFSVARAGSNTLVVWIDERHGGGVLDPRPEVVFETIWY